MKLKKKVILQILEKNATPLSLKQIRHRLGIKKQKQAKLKAILEELVVKGTLHQKNGSFMAPQVVARVSKHPPSDSATQAKTSKITGIFSKTARGFGFVNRSHGQDIYIGKGDQNGAMDGDRVEIVLINARSARTRGKIIRIIERRHHQFLARLMRGKKVTLAMPLYKKSSLPPVVISAENDLPDAQSGDWVAGVLLPSPPNSKELYGKLLRIMPAQTMDELAFDLILVENQIATEFSAEALKEAESFPKRVLYQPDSGRCDLRHLGFVTIDGKEARDFDDAVYAEAQEHGGYRLWVSIADVAHYVQPNQPLDQDAYQRGTSVYLPTHAIPMLPEVLSNQLCSLRPQVNRFTVTCEMKIDAQGKTHHYSIYESLIRSQARLTYEEVADFLQKSQGKGQGTKTGAFANKNIQESLKVMYRLSQILAKKRNRRGALDFTFPEYYPQLNEHREITGFCKELQSVSMKLIEQLMLEANETIARHCLKHKLPALYRVHDKPNRNKMEQFQTTFWHFGMTEKWSRLLDSKNLNQFLQKTANHPNHHQIQILLLKSMALACYSTRNQGHFGLAAKYYTHFTSPIRRYPDLMVHRALKAQLKAGRLGASLKVPPISQEVAEHLSHQERKAETVEKQSLELSKVVFLEKYLGQTFTAQVISTHSYGISVELKDLCVECLIPLESLHDDFYDYDEVRLELFGSHRNHRVEAGMLLRVRLVRTDRISRTLEFQLEDWLENLVA